MIDSYVSFQGFDDLEALGDDPWEASRVETLAEIGTGTGLEGLDNLRAIGAELEFQRQLAEQAAAEAETTREEIRIRLAELETALAIEDQLLLEAIERQERRLGEAAALADLEAELSEQIRVEEQRIADAIANRIPPGSGSVTVPPDSDIELVTVGGITVNVLVEEQVRGILAAMSARGFNLGGGGYRSIESQIRLRRANCGTSDYAIWEMPASRCRPPTARPGLSQRGRPGDRFHPQRSVLRTRNSDVFRALPRSPPVRVLQPPERALALVDNGRLMPVDIALIHPERPALIDDLGTTVTFAELLDRATRLGRAMHAAGVPVGGHVGTLTENRAEFFELYLASMLSGIWLVPINGLLAPSEVTYVARDADLAMIFAEDDLRPSPPTTSRRSASVSRTRR